MSKQEQSGSRTSIMDRVLQIRENHSFIWLKNILVWFVVHLQQVWANRDYVSVFVSQDSTCVSRDRDTGGFLWKVTVSAVLLNAIIISYSVLVLCHIYCFSHDNRTTALCCSLKGRWKVKNSHWLIHVLIFQIHYVFHFLSQCHLLGYMLANIKFLKWYAEILVFN